MPSAGFVGTSLLARANRYSARMQARSESFTVLDDRPAATRESFHFTTSWSVIRAAYSWPTLPLRDEMIPRHVVTVEPDGLVSRSQRSKRLDRVMPDTLSWKGGNLNASGSGLKSPDAWRFNCHPACNAARAISCNKARWVRLSTSIPCRPRVQYANLPQRCSRASVSLVLGSSLTPRVRAEPSWAPKMM